MLDLARAQHALRRLMAFFHERGYVGHIFTEDGGVRVVDLFEALEPGKEGAPEHCGGRLERWGRDGAGGRTVSAIFAIGDGVEAEIDLKPHYVLYGGVFDTLQLLLGRSTFVNCVASLEEIAGAEERA